MMPAFSNFFLVGVVDLLFLQFMSLGQRQRYEQMLVKSAIFNLEEKVQCLSYLLSGAYVK